MRSGSLWHPEAAAFCAAWVAVATAASVLEGFLAGTLLTFGLMGVLMPISAYLLGKKDDAVVERTVRWSVLILAGLILAVIHALGD
jgi:hypothetical protein